MKFKLYIVFHLVCSWYNLGLFMGHFAGEFPSVFKYRDNLIVGAGLSVCGPLSLIASGIPSLSGGHGTCWTPTGCAAIVEANK